MLAGAARPAAGCTWDDTYSQVIASATPVAGSNRSEEVRTELKRLRELLVRKAERDEVLRRGKTASGGAEQMRLEVLQANPFEYKAVWLFRGERVVVALVCVGGGIVEREASMDDWSRLAGLVAAVQPETWLNRVVDDGSAYFVSFSVAGKCKQFALYAPIFSSLVPDADRVFDEAAGGQKKLAEALLRLSKK